MGGFLDKPITLKHNVRGCGNGLKYAVASMQGWRRDMEDAHCATIGLNDDLKDWSFFAVFDGHIGSKVSAYASEHLLKHIVDSEEFRRSDFVEAIRSGFLRIDDTMRMLPEIGDGSRPEYERRRSSPDGSTAVCAFVSPQKIFVANCGDSRAVICNSGVPIFSTQDHKPSLKSESERIYRAGGYVTGDKPARLDGNLSLSRALGDFSFKADDNLGPCEQKVSPEPEISVLDRSEKDEFLVLACDGIWDVMSNEDICNFVRSRLLITDNLEDITNQIADTCLYKKSGDNMTIVLVTFPGAPTPCPEAIKKERKLEKFIRKRIRGIIKEHGSVKFEKVWDTLVKEDLFNLPPGGGIYAKRNFIENAFIDLCPDQADTIKENLKPNY